jgi:Amt family ammonium transporter
MWDRGSFCPLGGIMEGLNMPRSKVLQVLAKSLGGTDRGTVRRWAFIWLVLVGAGWFGFIPMTGCATQKASTDPTAAGAGVAPGATAPQGPKNDPNGTATGSAGDVVDAGGTALVAPDPGKKPVKADFKTDAEFQAALAKFKQADMDAYQSGLESGREPFAAKLANAVGHNRVAINMMWTLVTGFLVMFMQAGFAMVETGLTRAKNVSHTMAMNFLIYPLGMIGFYVCGFAFMFGGLGSASTMGGAAVMDGSWKIGDGWQILGTKGFFLSGNFYDVSVFALFFFQMVFMDTTATIPTGAAAERWKFPAFVLYGLAVGTVMYPIYGNWVWGGGWLSQLGSKLGLGHGTCDFAGSSVVHLQGGIIAFWFAKMMGPRLGKYNRDGSANVIPAHSVPMCVIGTFILAFGWFGFNPGSSLAGTDLRNAMSVTNTMLASATGALAATFWIWKVRGNKPDTTMMCNGMLAGLVAITAPCAFVTSWAACLIGVISGILVVESVIFFERKAKIDDPVGAISVHGVNGLWGIIALGLFADGSYGQGFNATGVTEYLGTKAETLKGVTGLFYGDPKQLLAQLIGGAACLTYVSIISIVVYKLIEVTVGNRVKPEVEIEGLDIPEMGVVGYAGIVLDKAGESPISKGWENEPVLEPAIASAVTAPRSLPDITGSDPLGDVLEPVSSEVLPKDSGNGK